MTKGQFVQYASEGGLENAEKIPFEILILMPEAWQAVGKVGGWCMEKDFKCDECADHYKWAMHRMIDALVEGRTAEQFLETL